VSFFFPRKINPGGALILPRPVAARGQVLWPKCARCMRAVDAYGIEEETKGHIEIWARCGGTRIDPATGGAVFGFLARNHPTMKSSTTILKGPGWSPQRFADIVSRLAFFGPEGDRQFVQNVTPEGVARRWGAG
jgi:hypothetical protein